MKGYLGGSLEAAAPQAPSLPLFGHSVPWKGPEAPFEEGQHLHQGSRAAGVEDGAIRAHQGGSVQTLEGLCSGQPAQNTLTEVEPMVGSKLTIDVSIYDIPFFLWQGRTVIHRSACALGSLHCKRGRIVRILPGGAACAVSFMGRNCLRSLMQC